MAILEKMNKLPRAIQNEIYEFARGDRKYWRSKFDHVMEHMYRLGDRAYLRQPNETKSQNMLQMIGWLDPKLLGRPLRTFRMWLRKHDHPIAWDTAAEDTIAVRHWDEFCDECWRLNIDRF